MKRLQALHLTKRFRGRAALQGVSLEVAPGEVVGLLGPNGSGKTTTFRIVMGELRPDGGRVVLNGEDLTGLPMHLRARRGLGYLPQEPAVFRKLTVEENLLVVLESLPLSAQARRTCLEETLEEFDLARLRHRRGWQLSGGERRRLEVARTLMTNPSFVLLDEPFTGVDPLATAELREMVASLRSRGLGVLISDHNVRETLRVCDRAYLLVEGRVLESGTPRQIIDSQRARQCYLGEEFQLW